MNGNNNQPPARNRGRKRGNNGMPAGNVPAAKKQKTKRGKRGVPGGPAFSEPTLHFAPVAIGVKMKKTKPIFTKSADHQRIVHREKIARIATPGTGAFTVLDAFSLNPGVSTTFPWLANQAAGYESYNFNRLRFVFVPSVGSAVPGTICMGPDYDANDAPPAGEIALGAYTDSDEERIWCPLAIECTPKLLRGGVETKFVRQGAIGQNQDIKTFDSGNFFVCSTDDTTVQTGKIWVEYDISLHNPQVPSGGFFQTSVCQAAPAASMSAAAIFGSAPVSTGAPFAAIVGNVVTMTGLVVGQRYYVNTTITGTVVSVLSLAYTSGATAVSGPIASLVTAGATQGALWGTFTATNEAAVLTYSATATTVTGSRQVISVLAPAVF